MKNFKIDSVMDLAWKKIKFKNQEETKEWLYNLGIRETVLTTLVERLRWEFLHFKKSPKRYMIFAGIYDSKIYLICKKCHLIMTSRDVKRPIIESPICPDCNNTFLYTFEILREGDAKHARMYNSLLIPSSWSRFKTKIKYKALHAWFCILDKLHI